MKTAHADIHSSRTVRTLIADDSPFMLKSLAQILGLEGNFTLVGTATDGYQAARQALATKPELILMDLHMPHLNGIEVTRYIKQFKNPPVVIIAASDDTPDSRALAKRAGADTFVTKRGDLRAQLKVIFRQLLNAHYD